MLHDKDMKHHLLSVAILASTVSGAFAANPWTYSDCVEYARTHNITLQKLRLNEQTASFNLKEAEAQWQPTLDFATTHSFANTPWGNSHKNTYNSSYGLNAGWTVWNGGERENTIKKNRVLTEISRLNTGDELRTLETDLLQVYINILYAKESIGIYEEAVRLSGAQADRARQLMEAGRVSRVDYSQLQSQYEQDRYALVNAQGLYDNRRMELKKLLELGIDTEIELKDVEWTAGQILAALPPIDESYTMAVDTDLRIKSLELEKKSSEYDVAIAKAGLKPRISLNAGVGTGYAAPGGAFGESMKRAFNESVGITFSLPILDGKRTSMAVARSKVQQLGAQLDIDSRLTEIAQLVENWYIDTRSAQARFTAAEEQLKSAELSNELTNEQFSLGLVNTIELMTAHNNLIEAQYTLLQAKYMAMLGRKMIEFYCSSTVTLD